MNVVKSFDVYRFINLVTLTNYFAYVFRMYIRIYDYITCDLDAKMRLTNHKDVIVNDYTFTEIIVRLRHRVYNLVFIKDNDFESLGTYIQNRNVIVNCSIIERTDTEGNTEDNTEDVTDTVRAFCRYYCTKTSFRYCTEYIKYRHNLSSNRLGLAKLVVYWNDDGLTESVYNLTELSEMTFADVFAKRLEEINILSDTNNEAD